MPAKDPNYYKEYYQANKEKIKATAAAWDRANKEKLSERRKRWQAKARKEPIGRFKHNARETLKRAVKSGHIIKLPCNICGDLNVEAHHDDYNKPLEVRWLCRKHHLEYH